MNLRNYLFVLVTSLLLHWMFAQHPFRNSLELKSNDPSQTDRKMVYDQFILFGDSLFQHSTDQDRGFGLHPALQAEFIRRLDVINRGFGGYNTDQALKVLPHIIPPPDFVQVRFLAIFFGANDACLEGLPGGTQHVPLTRYKENIIKMINHPLVKKQAPRIILVTPPPLNQYATEEADLVKGYKEVRRTAANTKMYADAVKEVAASQNVACLDLWTTLMTTAGWDGEISSLPGSKEVEVNYFLKSLLHDGLHFTGVAYSIFFQELMRLIQRTWPEQMPSKLPFVLPQWNEPSKWAEWEEGTKQE